MQELLKLHFCCQLPNLLRAKQAVGLSIAPQSSLHGSLLCCVCHPTLEAVPVMPHTTVIDLPEQACCQTGCFACLFLDSAWAQGFVNANQAMLPLDGHKTVLRWMCRQCCTASGRHVWGWWTTIPCCKASGSDTGKRSEPEAMFLATGNGQYLISIMSASYTFNHHAFINPLQHTVQYSILYTLCSITSTTLYICKDYVLHVRKDESACIIQCIACQCITFVFRVGVLLMSRTV